MYSIRLFVIFISETPTAVYGQKLHAQVEERLSFYETGDAPRKNIDIMREAMVEVCTEQGLKQMQIFPWNIVKNCIKIVKCS